MSIRVESYAGYRGEQEPRAFVFEGQRIDVDQVIDRWLAPDHRYFKVKDAAGRLYVLRHEIESGEWTVTASRLPLSS